MLVPHDRGLCFLGGGRVYANSTRQGFFSRPSSRSLTSAQPTSFALPALTSAIRRCTSSSHASAASASGGPSRLAASSAASHARSSSGRVRSVSRKCTAASVMLLIVLQSPPDPVLAEPAPGDVDDVPRVVDPCVRERLRLERDVHPPHLAPGLGREDLGSLLRKVPHEDAGRMPRIEPVSEQERSVCPLDRVPGDEHESRRPDAGRREPAERLPRVRVVRVGKGFGLPREERRERVNRKEAYGGSGHATRKPFEAEALEKRRRETARRANCPRRQERERAERIKSVPGARVVDVVEAEKTEPDDEGENARGEPRVPPAAGRRDQKEDERDEVSPWEAPDRRIEIVKVPGKMRRKKLREGKAVVQGRDGQPWVIDDVPHAQGITRQGEVLGEQKHEGRRPAEHEKPDRPRELLPAGHESGDQRGQQEEHSRLRADDDPERPEKSGHEERARAGSEATLRQKRETPRDDAQTCHV